MSLRQNKVENFDSEWKRARAIYDQGLRNVAQNSIPDGQKFLPGTFVWVAKDLGESMSHFLKDRPARVQYTYAHAFGGSNIYSYSLLIRYDSGKWSSVAWYKENQITEINDLNLIDAYLKEIEASA